MSDSEQKKGPDMIASSVVDVEGQEKGFWTRIGSAFKHKDGKGYNVLLNALPVNGKIVLREPLAEEGQ